MNFLIRHFYEKNFFALIFFFPFFFFFAYPRTFHFSTDEKRIHMGFVRQMQLASATLQHFVLMVCL